MKTIYIYTRRLKKGWRVGWIQEKKKKKGRKNTRKKKKRKVNQENLNI